MISIVTAILAAVFYLVAAFRQWRSVVNNAPIARWTVLGSCLIGVGFHAVALSQTLINPAALNLAMFQIGSLISLVITLLLLFSSWNKAVDNLLIGLLPMAAVVAIAAALSPQEMLMTNVSPMLGWHILLSVLAYSLFTIAAVHSILIIMQDRHLRRHKTRGLIRSLPPLQTMDALLFEMIWLGILILTAAFAIGFPEVVDLKAQHLVHKIVFACLGWLVFAILLFGRYRFGWRGVTAGRWTLTGTSFLVLSYFGSQFVLEYILNR